jgi:hypothetical protein
MVHRLVNRPPEPELRELALLRGGIYGHRKFAEGQQLPLAREQVNKLPFILPITYPNEQQMLEFYAGHGIRPRQVVGRTQHYDVMSAMTKRGVGVACLTDALLPAEMRDEVIMLHPLENWRLMWHRKDAGGDPRCDAVQAFLMSSVLQDPNYRTISLSAGGTDSAAVADLAGSGQASPRKSGNSCSATPRPASDLEAATPCDNLGAFPCGRRAASRYIFFGLTLSCRRDRLLPPRKEPQMKDLQFSRREALRAGTALTIGVTLGACASPASPSPRRA